MRIVTPIGVIEIPLSVEAEGGAAIEAYVAQQLAAAEPQES